MEESLKGAQNDNMVENDEVSSDTNKNSDNNNKEKENSDSEKKSDKEQQSIYINNGENVSKNGDNNINEEEVVSIFPREPQTSRSMNPRLSSPGTGRINLKTNNIGAQQLVKMKTMSDSERTIAEVERDIEVDSLIRQYAASRKDIARFLHTRDIITEKQNAIMNESVDFYIKRVKESLPPLQHKIKPRYVFESEIPVDFCSTARPCRKSIAKLFDRAGYYKNKQLRTVEKLPDTFVTQKFKEYLEINRQPIPQCLLDSDISDRIIARYGKRVTRYRSIPRCFLK